MNRAATTLFLVLLLSAAPAQPKDLVAVFEDALRNDPVIRQADANRLAAREARPQAWSAVLPQLNATAGVTRDHNAGFQDQINEVVNPSNPNGPPLGTRLWANAGSTIPIKVNFDSTYVNDGQPVQVLVVAETQSKRLNIWWASIQPK